MSEPQLEFFPRSRPFLERFGAEFFRAIPRRAGVYVMTGEANRVLYIGKAKDLRQRLCSYKYIRAAGKTWRLACRVRAITWELCDDAPGASLRENELLRLHKPTFNVVNTRAEHYPFLGLRCTGSTVELRITKVAQRQRGEELFGAFKGLPLVRSGFAALMRLMWAAQHQLTSPFDFPSALLAERLEHWMINGSSAVTQLEDFFSGRSDKLIDATVAQLPKEISRFQRAFHEHDIEFAREFFLRGPKRNAELRSMFQLNDALVAQTELDDLLVLRRAGENQGLDGARPSENGLSANAVAEPAVVG